eukprot:5353121-Pyramimonas_sp.AAC.1
MQRPASRTNCPRRERKGNDDRNASRGEGVDVEVGGARAAIPIEAWARRERGGLGACSSLP